MVFVFILQTTLCAGTLDSLRMEMRDGKQYIIHRVESGETMYGISRRYKADISAIVAANNLGSQSLNLGQVIAIPYTGTATASIRTSEVLYHTTKAGETLYSISRQYGVTVDEIKSLNKMSGNSLEIGQRLIIKSGSATATTLNTPNASNTVNPKNISSEQQHTVAPSETLFSISRKYNVSVEAIKELNMLDSNALSVGQSLKIPVMATNEMPAVVDATPVVAPITEQVDKKATVDEVKKEILETPVAQNDAQKETVQGKDSMTNQRKEPIIYGNYDKSRQSHEGFEEIMEEGFAMKIDNAPNTQKYLALHRTLPIGKILQVRNQMNNQSIYVRVVGKLPDTGVNNNVLIRLSDQAFERLGALDAKIPVEVTYLP